MFFKVELLWKKKKKKGGYGGGLICDACTLTPPEVLQLEDMLREYIGMGIFVITMQYELHYMLL